MIIRLICALVFIILAPFLGGWLSGLERVLGARMQGRKGPSVWQSFYDVRKLFMKEAGQVNNNQMMLVGTHLAFVIITGVLFFAGWDLLLVFFVLTTAAMFLVGASATTYSPYSSLGANREMMQMMAYEPMVLLTCVGFYLACGSFDVTEIISTNTIPVLKLPGCFIGFLFILTIKLRKSPFDISTSHHAHQEIVKGITTEMSGQMLALYEIAEWYEKVFLMACVGMFFVNSNPFSYILAVAVCIIVFFLEVLIDNTSARVTWKQMFKSSWIVALVFGGINIIVLEIFK